MMIRPMKDSDLVQVATIESELFSDPWTEEDFWESLQQPAASFLVAVLEKGDIAGYCGSYRVLDESEIVNVAVRKDCQNRGIARVMVAQLMAADVKSGVRRFILEVRKSNLAAQHVYESLGFCSVGVRKGFYTQPVEDAVIMQMEDVSIGE